jgi:hypothetical protein
MPDEIDAMIESTGVASSMSANNLILKSTRSIDGVVGKV